jgi:predicted dehydrogenase
VSQAVDPKIRGAVVGAGHMGQYHILALAEIWGVELIGVVDTDFAKAERIAAPYGARAYRDHRELAGQIDFATVAVPTEQHFTVARELLEAGAHVLVEKPMTSTLEEAKELFRVAREQNRVLHVGHVERFNGAVQELRKIVERPILIESRRLGPFVPRVQNDSVVMDLMIHDIDIVLGLVDGEPRKVTAVGSSVQSQVTDVATVQIVFDSGAMATITAPLRRRSAPSPSRSRTPTSCSTTRTRTSRSTGAPRRSTRSTASPSAIARPPSWSTCWYTRTIP